MGIVKKAFKMISPIAILAGMADGKKSTTQPKPAAAAATGTNQTAADIAANEEDEKRKRLLALNAGGSAGQLTPAGGVTGASQLARKTLTGQ